MGHLDPLENGCFGITSRWGFPCISWNGSYLLTKLSDRIAIFFKVYQNNVGYHVVFNCRLCDVMGRDEVIHVRGGGGGGGGAQAGKKELGYF